MSCRFREAPPLSDRLLRSKGPVASLQRLAFSVLLPSPAFPRHFPRASSPPSIESPSHIPVRF